MIGVFNPDKLNHSDKIRERLVEDHQNADEMMMKILLAHWLVAGSVMGLGHGMYLFGAISGAVICAFAYISKRLLKGTIYFRIIAGACFMLFSMVFIQQQLGRIEMHFHVFVALAMLARYKDITPQISALTTILIHHLIINYCQSESITLLGSPLVLFNYGTGLDIIIIHAVPATLESVVLGIIIYQLTQQYCLSLEKTFDTNEVITTLDNIITSKDLSSKLPESNEYARLVNQLLELLNSNTALRGALDNASVSLMVTNNNFEVVDYNSTVQELFKDASEGITAQIPSLDCNNLMGASIEPLLEKTSSPVNLSNLSTQENLQLEFGEHIFKVIVNPVTNEAGEKLGYIVEWQDHTSEVEIENEINTIVEAAKAGDLAKRIDLHGKRGFFKSLSDGINDMITIVERNLADIASTVTAMSKGDLSNRVKTNDAGKFGEVRDSINDTLSTLEDMVQKIRSSSNVITQSADKIANSNDNLARRTEVQTANLEETAASIDEMTSTVQNNADNAHEASKLANKSSEQAQHGGEVVRNAINAMHEINTSSGKISNIISVIDEIAFQTNLLALNAAVEAARAGEQGKGFAVVATEVRNLAQRSASAAKEITDLIQESVAKVETGNELVDESGKVLEQIVESVTQVSTLMSEIASANQEQSQGIEQVNKAIGQMDEMNHQNSSMVQETTNASEELSRQANNMDALMSFFAAGNVTSNEEIMPDKEEQPMTERRKQGRPWG